MLDVVADLCKSLKAFLRISEIRVLILRALAGTKRRGDPVKRKYDVDVLGTEEPWYSAKAYLHEAENYRRRTWINPKSNLFKFIDRADV